MVGGILQKTQMSASSNFSYKKLFWEDCCECWLCHGKWNMFFICELLGLVCLKMNGFKKCHHGFIFSIWGKHKKSSSVWSQVYFVKLGIKVWIKYSFHDHFI